MRIFEHLFVYKLLFVLCVYTKRKNIFEKISAEFCLNRRIGSSSKKAKKRPRCGVQLACVCGRVLACVRGRVLACVRGRVLACTRGRVLTYVRGV